MATRTAPITIAGKGDHSRNFWHWINETGNPGDLLRLPLDCNLTCNYPIELGGSAHTIDDITLNLRGATITRDPLETIPDPGYAVAGSFPRDNALFKFRYIDGLAIFSSHPCFIHMNNRQAWYIKGKRQLGVQFYEHLEAQHIFDVNDIKGFRKNISICLSNIDCAFTYGDGVYVGGGTENFELTGDPTRGIGGGAWGDTFLESDGFHPGIHHVGRQLVSICAATNWSVHDVALWQGRRSCFDLEPAGTRAYVKNGQIYNNKCGEYRLNWLASKGQGHVDDIEVFDNATSGNMIITMGNKLLKRRNIEVHNNVSTSRFSSGTAQAPNAMISFRNVDNVVIQNNYQRFNQRTMFPVEFVEGSSNYTDKPNQWVAVP